jgi:hypothetical protein
MGRNGNRTADRVDETVENDPFRTTPWRKMREDSDRLAKTGSQGASLGLKTWFACLMFCCWAHPARGAGIQLLETPALAGAIWYPCAAKPQSVPLGSLGMSLANSLEGVKDCPVVGAKLPLVVFSHGQGGWFGLHHDTAETLADAGFVVAALSRRAKPCRIGPPGPPIWFTWSILC